MEENKKYDAFENLFVGKVRFVNLAIVAVNVIIFTVMCLLPKDIHEIVFMYGSAYTPAILDGQYYRLFTSMFLHFNSTHLFGNMLMILFVGDELESITGHFRYFLLAIISGLLGNIASVYFDIAKAEYPLSAGASGLAYGILGGMIACIIRKRTKRKIPFERIAIITVLTLIGDFNTTGINAVAHLGGLIGGLLLGLI